MKWRYLTTIFVYGLLQGAESNASSQPSPSKNPSSVIAQAETYLNNLQTFSAHFEQVAPQQQFSTGRFYLQRPKKFLWHYTSPHEQKLISTGAHIYFYDVAAQQVTQIPGGHSLAALLTADKINLSKNKNFKITGTTIGDQLTSIELSPTDEDSPLRKIAFLFDQPNLQLVRITTTDTLGQTTRVHFHNIKENTLLDKALFDFTPPHYEYQD